MSEQKMEATYRQLASSHSPCQLLASFLRHSRAGRQLPTLAPAVAIVWKCWSDIGVPRIPPWFRDGWQHVQRGQRWRITGSNSDPPIGEYPLWHSQQWQRSQCSDPWEDWNGPIRLGHRSMSNFHGGRLGPPCQPLGNHDTDFVAACSENANGGPVRHWRLTSWTTTEPFS